MHSALLVVEKPDFAMPGKTEAWMGLIKSAASESDKCKDIQMLSETVLLIQLQSGFSALAVLVAKCREADIVCRVLFLEREPEWITSSERLLPCEI